MIDVNDIWNWSRIIAAIATASSFVIAVLTYRKNIRDKEVARDIEARKQNQLYRTRFWSEVGAATRDINSIELDLDPAESRTNNLYLSDFDADHKSERYLGTLYKQLNLMHLAYLYKDIIRKDESKKFEDWARYTLNCWIEKVEPLQEHVANILSGTEFYSDEFIETLEKLLPRPYVGPNGEHAEKVRDLLSHRKR